MDTRMPFEQHCPVERFLYLKAGEKCHPTPGLQSPKNCWVAKETQPWGMSNIKPTPAVPADYCALRVWGIFRTADLYISAVFKHFCLGLCAPREVQTLPQHGVTQNLLCCISSILLHQGMTDKQTARSTALGRMMQIVVLGSQQRTMKNTMIWRAIQGI